MNNQNENKISWCDATLNPVVGCPRGCPYCYARRLNERFKWVEDFCKPQFFPERLDALKSKTPKSIFMNSMSDIEFWREKYFDETLASIIKNPQHNYIFLTKLKSLPYAFFKDLGIISSRIFFGGTVTTQSEAYNMHDDFDFINIEPILTPLKLNRLNTEKLIIIGAETGKRKGKVLPRKEWITDIVRQADASGVSVFMKNSLRGLMGAEFRQDRLPWEVKNNAAV